LSELFSYIVTLILTEAQIEQIVAHTKAEAPKEACGMLVGTAGRVTQVLPAINVAENPAVEYLMDPHDQLRHFQAMEEQGLELLGIYHSHPASPAFPSATDLSMAYYPEAVYVIASLADSEKPVLRAFRIVDDQISEVSLKVVPIESADGQSTNLQSESV
jgi:proteasome lid subunit RPN8/RPN11